MSICQLGMHKSVQDHTNANVCKQTYDASCMPQGITSNTVSRTKQVGLFTAKSQKAPGRDCYEDRRCWLHASYWQVTLLYKQIIFCEQASTQCHHLLLQQLDIEEETFESCRTLLDSTNLFRPFANGFCWLQLRNACSKAGF